MHWPIIECDLSLVTQRLISSGKFVQPFADRVAQHLEIISKNFQSSTRRTRMLMGFIIYYLVPNLNPMGRILVRWKSFRIISRCCAAPSAIGCNTSSSSRHTCERVMLHIWVGDSTRVNLGMEHMQQARLVWHIRMCVCVCFQIGRASCRERV